MTNRLDNSDNELSALSGQADSELYEMSKSGGLRQDMRRVSLQRHNPFIKDGKPDIDAFLEFVMEYNEFINHQPRPFHTIKDTFMIL